MSSQLLHCPHQPIPTKAYPTMARPATSNHYYDTNHLRPPHIVNGPPATPITPLTGTAKPLWRLRLSDHHIRDFHHLTTTSTLRGSFRAAEQLAHRHGRDNNGLHVTTMSNTKPHRRPCPRAAAGSARQLTNHADAPLLLIAFTHYQPRSLFCLPFG